MVFPYLTILFFLFFKQTCLTLKLILKFKTLGLLLENLKPNYPYPDKGKNKKQNNYRKQGKGKVE